MPAIDANGITIEYESRGDGEPLLLVMGLGGQLIDWPDEFVDGLVAAGFRVITFDNRDIGLSTEFTWEAPSQVKAVLRSLARRKVKSEYRLTDMAADAVGLLDALEVESAHVVGISMGGMIAQTIAIEHPGRVRSLTSIMSHTGDRRHGKIALKLLPKLARLGAPTRETAIERSVATFRLVSGPHFDESEQRLLAKRGLERSFRPEGTARQTTAIMAGPDRTRGTAAREGAHARGPRARRPARAAERWRRHGTRRARRPAHHVSRHGPRPAPPALGRPHDRDPSHRRPRHLTRHPKMEQMSRSARHLLHFRGGWMGRRLSRPGGGRRGRPSGRAPGMAWR